MYLDNKEAIQCLEEALRILKSMPKDATNNSMVSAKPDEVDLIRDIAKKNRFEKHVLSNYSDTVKDCYITALLMITEQVQDSVVLRTQMTFIGRILAAFDPNVDMQTYVIKKMKVDKQFWSDFSDLINNNLAVSFAVDAFVIVNLAGAEKDKNMDSAIDLMQMLGLEQKYIMKAAQIAKTILTQKFFGFLELLEHEGTVDYNSFLCYFEAYKNYYMTSDIKDGVLHDGKVIFVDGDFRISNCYRRFPESDGMNPVSGGFIHLTKFKAKENIFYRCNFSDCYRFILPGGKFDVMYDGKIKKYLFLNNYGPKDCVDVEENMGFGDKTVMRYDNNKVTEFYGNTIKEVKVYEL